MYPAVIDNYVRPKTVAEAASALAEAGEDALFIAGGMSLMQAIKSRMVAPTCLVDLQGVEELKGVTLDSSGVRIGAMTRYREIADDGRLNGAYQALIDATSHVGDRQVRNRGTIGGSLCWNYIAACSPATAIGVGATVELMSSTGEQREMAAEDFLGSPLETERADDEIMIAVTLPPAPANTGSAYKKWGLVADALPVVGVVVLIETDGSRKCTRARVAFSGLGAGPCRSAGAEQGLIGASSDDGEKIDAAFQAAAGELEIHGDMWADEDYRKLLIGELGRDVTATAFKRAAGQG
jgi:aerobic carbon-monoxide dehydrogenase medium subunit